MTQRYRIEVHTLTGDVHASDWVPMDHDEVTETAEMLRDAAEKPLRLQTADGAHVVVPAPQIASVRVVPEETATHE
jgi:hypothetical protein